MTTYRVRFRFKGAFYIEDITCFGPGAARQAILGRYPGATIYNITSIGKAK